MDDQSDDGAPHLIRERYAHDPSVKLITRQAPKSMGDALREGFLAAKGHTIIFMDGNGNHDPMLLGNMIQNRHDYQAISGSRFATGGHCLNPYKHVLSQNFNRWVRLCLGLPTRDNTSGYLCFQKEALNQLHPETALQHGPTYGLHLMFMAQKCGLSILELPTRSRQSFPNPFKKRPWNRLKGYCSTVVKLTLSRFGWC
jgi:dolichol-phosphate mannosyltransferase